MGSGPDPVHAPPPRAIGGMDARPSNRRSAPRPVQCPHSRVSGRVESLHRPGRLSVFGMETDRDGFRRAGGHTG